MIWALLLVGIAGLTLGALFMQRGIDAFFGVLTRWARGGIDALPVLVVVGVALSQDRAALAFGATVGANLWVVVALVPLVARLARPAAAVPSHTPLALAAAALALWGATASLGPLVAIVALLAAAVSRWQAARPPDAAGAPPVATDPDTAPPPAAWLGAGVLALGLGGWSLVSGATDLARAIGAHDEGVGLTAVALGATAPLAGVALARSARGDAQPALEGLLDAAVVQLLVAVAGIAWWSPGPLPTGLLVGPLPLLAVAASAPPPADAGPWAVVARAAAYLSCLIGVASLR